MENKIIIAIYIIASLFISSIAYAGSPWNDACKKLFGINEGRNEVEKEKVKRAKELNIPPRVNTICPGCGSIIYLTRIQYLDILDGVTGPQVTCGRCQYSYDVQEGIRNYVRYENQQRAERAEQSRQYLAGWAAQQQVMQQQKELIKYQAEQNRPRSVSVIVPQPTNKTYIVNGQTVNVRELR